MEFIPQNKILEFKPDTLERVRKNNNLYKPGEMKEAIKILKEWVRQQSHLRKKDFSEFFLETTILGSKGSIEKAKKQVDKSCTMRTLLPHFYGNFEVKNDFPSLFSSLYSIILPKQSKDGHRVYLFKSIGKIENTSHLLNLYRYAIILAEYTKSHDYTDSFHYILDLRDANMSDFVTKVNLVELKQAITIFLYCYSLRLIGIYIITTSKLVDVLISLLKQILKPKMMSRLHHYPDCNEIINIIGKDVLPIELGGTERCIHEIQNHWIEILSSKEHMEYIREMNVGSTDESYRPRDTFVQDYDGVPGTFRVLNVD